MPDDHRGVSDLPVFLIPKPFMLPALPLWVSAQAFC